MVHPGNNTALWVKAIFIYLGVHELDRLHVVTDTLSQSLLVPELRGDPCKLKPTIQGIFGVGGAKENKQKQLNKDSIMNYEN